MAVPVTGGLVVVGEDGVPCVNGIPLGARAAAQVMADAVRADVPGGQEEEGQPVRVPGLGAVQEWLAGQQETRAFRARVGVAPMSTMQRHQAQAQAGEAGEAREQAQRRQQAEASRIERLQALTAESGMSLEELSRVQLARRMVAERQAERAEADAADERRMSAEAKRAALYAAGHRPRDLSDILAGAAMFP